ncbi:MAG: hypothetical protein WCR54_07950 [Clostridia bacterium]
MGLFNKKNKDGNVSTKMIYVSGVEQYDKRAYVELSLADENLQIKCKKDIYPPAYVPLERITNVGFINDKEIIEKSKSVGGRAFVGGILLGPVGAIVGGMSGIGNKKNTHSRCYMVVNYKSTSGELNAITFEAPEDNLNYFSFMKKLEAKIKTKEMPSEIRL